MPYSALPAANALHLPSCPAGNSDQACTAQCCQPCATAALVSPVTYPGVEIDHAIHGCIVPHHSPGCLHVHGHELGHSTSSRQQDGKHHQAYNALHDSTDPIKTRAMKMISSSPQFDMPASACCIIHSVSACPLKRIAVQQDIAGLCGDVASDLSKAAYQPHVCCCRQALAVMQGCRYLPSSYDGC